MAEKDLSQKTYSEITTAQKVEMASGGALGALLTYFTVEAGGLTALSGYGAGELIGMGTIGGLGGVVSVVAGEVIGSEIDEITGFSEKFEKKHTSEMHKMLNESGNTTSMARKDPDTGLPMITFGQNTELGRIVAHGSVEEAGKLSPNPLLAAKHVHNFEDIPYIQKKIEEAEADLEKFDGRNFLQRMMGMVDQGKVVLESDLIAAKYQFFAYKNEFEKWEQQNGIAKTDNTDLNKTVSPVDIKGANALIER
jgi:hypothetical protein